MTFQHFSNFEGKYSVGSVWSLIKKVDQHQILSQKRYCFSLLYTYFHKFMQVIDGDHHSAISIVIHHQVTCFVKVVFSGDRSPSTQYLGETKSKGPLFKNTEAQVDNFFFCCSFCWGHKSDRC